MANFNEMIVVETVFGKIEVIYVAPGQKKENIFDFSDNPKMGEVLSHYVATVLNGDYNGWNATGIDRAEAVQNVVAEIAARYAYDVTREAEK